MAWKFDKKITNIFEDHILRSVPGYLDGHNLIISLSKDLLSDNSTVLDIGCSKGTLLKKIDQALDLDISYIGLDISKDMINAAKKTNKSKRIKYYNKNIRSFNKKNFDLIFSYYTIQFIHPSKKLNFIKSIYNKLNNDCYFLVFEKVIEKSGNYQKFFDMAYNDFKENNNFKPDEIYKKTHSLRGSMHSVTREENIRNFKISNFKNIKLIYKNLFFEGYIMKK